MWVKFVFTIFFTNDQLFVNMKDIIGLFNQNKNFLKEFYAAKVGRFSEILVWRF